MVDMLVPLFLIILFGFLEKTKKRGNLLYEGGVLAVGSILSGARLVFFFFFFFLVFFVFILIK
jgi:hypothetical protein